MKSDNDLISVSLEVLEGAHHSYSALKPPHYIKLRGASSFYAPYLHSSLLIPHSSLLIPHSSLDLEVDLDVSYLANAILAPSDAPRVHPELFTSRSIPFPYSNHTSNVIYCNKIILYQVGARAAQGVVP